MFGLFGVIGSSEKTNPGTFSFVHVDPNNLISEVFIVSERTVPSQS